jgi:DNA ligase-1
MIEKFDGVRVFYDGVGTLYTKHMKPIPVPPFFLQGFPKVPFEGDLWSGYNSLAVSQELIKDPKHTGWVKAKIMVTDLPLMRGTLFEQRMELIKKRIFT